ncbi:MAG: prepilin-type N-terminal cleavage/methylation domain-containing protein [Lachnospiraceae bacterium]|nr:prepilin-type N-terminal cleavage/methylation domain-containing protein [Lachnospiraceae bacterium]
MKRDNKGFSLIELVVIVAIIAILVGAMGVNLGLIKKYHAKECRQMIYSSLENGRLIALSKSAGGTSTDTTKTYLAFFRNTTDNCNYYAVVVEDVVTDVKKISKADVKIYFGPTNSTADPSAIAGFTCLDSYSFAVGKKNLSINMLTDDPTLLDSAVTGGYRIAYNRSTGGFLKDSSGNINLSIYSNSGKYYYPVFLYQSTGKIQTAPVIIR